VHIHAYNRSTIYGTWISIDRPQEPRTRRAQDAGTDRPESVVLENVGT
jgi:hypothetical protein